MIVFAADLHITKRVWKARRDLDGDAFRALLAFRGRILELHQTEPVSVILGGDIFDKNAVKGAPLNAFTEFVDVLFEAGIPVYTVMGNHELDEDISLAEVQGAISLDKETHTVDCRKVHGLDWRTREEIQEELKVIPKEVEVLVLHGMMEHLIDFQAAADFSMDLIPSHVKHVVVGDIHVNDVVVTDGTTCVSPGPLHPTKIDQEGPYGFYTLAAGADEWVREDIPGREIRRFAMMSDQDVKSIEAALPTIQATNTVKNLEPIVEVKYISEYCEIVDRWVTQFPGIRFFTKPSAKGKILSKEDLEEAQESFNELSLVNSLPMVVEPKDKELYDFMHSCLTGNTQQIVEKKVEPFLCSPSA